MSRRPAVDVAVIGGGIVGTASAALLAERGMTVALYEREALAAGASGRNSGVVQSPFDHRLRDLYGRTVALYRRLEAERAGFVLGDEPAGLLLVSRDEALVLAFTQHLAAESPDLLPETVAGTVLRELEPSLGPDLVACRMPIGFPVVPSSGTYAFATLAERLAVRLRTGREVSVALDRGRAAGVVLDGQLEPAGTVVVAAGPWTPGLLDPSGRWRPVTELWGVVVETILAVPPRHVMEEAELDAALGTPDAPDDPHGPHGPAGESSAAPAVRESGFSLVSAAGVSSVGSTFLAREPILDDWQVPLLDRASSFVPAIEEAPIRGIRACARPASADGRPLIGPVPWIERCYTATGHGAWGISTGPGSADLLVDVILGASEDAIPPELRVGRFGVPAA